MGAILTATAAAGQWVASKCDTVFAPEAMTVVGLERDGRMVAGILYENWNGASIVAHIAIHGKATAEFFRFNADYAFRQCRVIKVIAPIASDNIKSIQLATKIGFQEEARLRECHPHGDILLFTLTAGNCRFLRGPYRKTTAAAIA